MAEGEGDGETGLCRLSLDTLCTLPSGVRLLGVTESRAAPRPVCRLDTEQLLELRPGHPPPFLLRSRLRRKPSLVQPGLVRLRYHSGTSSFCRERWTRSSCSERVRLSAIECISWCSGGWIMALCWSSKR